MINWFESYPVLLWPILALDAPSEALALGRLFTIISKGFRKVADTSPSLCEQFDSRWWRMFRLPAKSASANIRRASLANPSSAMPSSI